jgi:hypothetical protein
MHRAKLTVLVACALAAAGLATVRLAAQPEPYKPISTTDASYELVLPPGTYHHLVVAFEGGTASKTAKAILKAPSGDMTILISGGETIVIPLSPSGWTTSQAVTLKLTQPSSQFHVSAITQAGPVKLEAAKK